jgi:tol-pal system protein YbgF
MTPSTTARLRLRRPAAALILAGAALWAGPSAGQDTGTMLNRLNRLENEVDALNRQVYRGAAPPAASGSTSPGLSGNLAADFEVRLQRLESEIANLTGRTEEAQFGVTQLRQRLERMQEDLDVRLQELDQRLSAGGAAAASAATASGQAAAGPAPGAQTSSAQQGRAPAAAAPPAPAPQPRPQQGGPAQPEGQLPAGGAQEQYDRAFALLRGADYAKAEQALSQFIKSYPNHSLTPNAQYWLAETYYARNRYREAAVAYGEAYQKAPKGPKAADNLLKLGMSLAALNRRDDACVAFSQIGKEFPDAPATVKRRADQERGRLDCR